MLDTLSKFIQELRQYVVLKEGIDFQVKRQNDLKQRLMEALMEVGETDSKGSTSISINEEHLDVKSVTRQARVSKTLNMDIAEDILTKKGIKDRCIKMVPMINEEEIMAAYYEGLLTEDEIDSMFPAKTTYALVIK